MLLQTRGTLLHSQNTATQYNFAKPNNREGLLDKFDDPTVKKNIGADLEMIATIDRANILQGGEATEYGEKSNDYLVEIRLQYFFWDSEKQERETIPHKNDPEHIDFPAQDKKGNDHQRNQQGAPLNARAKRVVNSSSGTDKRNENAVHSPLKEHIAFYLDKIGHLRRRNDQRRHEVTDGADHRLPPPGG